MDKISSASGVVGVGEGVVAKHLLWVGATIGLAFWFWDDSTDDFTRHAEHR